MTVDPSLDRIIVWLHGIGQPVRRGPLSRRSVLPGVTVVRGTLVVDAQKLAAAGDLLHEAGHLAILAPEVRAAADDDLGADGGYEMGAIAWSWAASCALDLDPAMVFHSSGYDGSAPSLIENFTAGRFVGVPILEWLGLTTTGDRAAELGVAPFPAMIRWRV